MPRPLSVTFFYALVASLSLVSFSLHGESEQPLAKQVQAKAPTGIYSVETPVRLTLTLETNGTYELRSDLSVQSGKWHWNLKKQEFRLTPTSKEFPFDLRRLRVDRDNPQYLQWIPVEATSGSASGAIDYLRLKRK
jgi:hypothetical protein